ncbi:MAG: type II toxin-antitoxin system HicB family antitoxin [Erysipelotrichaceae bacterium]|nr:type II toxin-antitoxin system HicB family antitoxin [Erysipelotrichaceae bacterium]
MKYYPAVFVQEEDGKYSVTFPDIPEAITFGNNLKNAIEMAEECLGLCLIGRIEDNEEMPSVCYDNIKLEENEFIVLIKFDSIEFNKKYNNKSVRKNVTIPAWLNEIAEKRNINFSKVLQNALCEMLGL